MFEVSLGNLPRPCLKKREVAGDLAHRHNCLPDKHQVVSLILGTNKEKGGTWECG